jgi:hypothetical protein
MPTNYAPLNEADFRADGLNFKGQGIIGVAIAGASTNFDFVLPEDRLISGGALLCKGANWGDNITFQVVDKDGILAPAGTVLNEFVTDWYIMDSSEFQLELRCQYPAKIYQGLYVRLIYNSTGTSNVNVAMNYEFHKVLV